MGHSAFSFSKILPFCIQDQLNIGVPTMLRNNFAVIGSGNTAMKKAGHLFVLIAYILEEERHEGKQKEINLSKQHNRNHGGCYSPDL